MKSFVFTFSFVDFSKYRAVISAVRVLCRNHIIFTSFSDVSNDSIRNMDLDGYFVAYSGKIKFVFELWRN